jgi:hypothetical protein
MKTGQRAEFPVLNVNSFLLLYEKNVLFSGNSKYVNYIATFKKIEYIKTTNSVAFSP